MQAALCPSVPFGQKATCLSSPPQRPNSYLVSNSGYPIAWSAENEQNGQRTVTISAVPPSISYVIELVRIGVPTASIRTVRRYARGQGQPAIFPVLSPLFPLHPPHQFGLFMLVIETHLRKLFLPASTQVSPRFRSPTRLYKRSRKRTERPCVLQKRRLCHKWG